MQPRKIIQHHTGYLLQKQMTGALSPRRALTSILDAQDLARQLPARINTITDKLVTDRFTFRIQAVDEPHILKNLHGMVNRLSIAIVLAALIIGAAMMMQVETDFELLGYPALATILFLAAVACGFALVVSIFLGERKSKPASNRHPPEP
ncbi:MAG: AarF/ABC1/UbiB kinase family protein, partial [Bacteroidota bacterium]